MSLVFTSTRSLRARLALVFALSALPLGAMSFMAAGAQATQVEWLNELVPAHTERGGYPDSTHMLSNTVYYTGSGSISVCENVWDHSTGIFVSVKCGTNFAEATPAELEPHLGNDMEARGLNNSGFAHTIHGVYVK